MFAFIVDQGTDLLIKGSRAEKDNAYGMFNVFLV